MTLCCITWFDSVKVCKLVHAQKEYLPSTFQLHPTAKQYPNVHTSTTRNEYMYPPPPATLPCYKSCRLQVDTVMRRALLTFRILYTGGGGGGIADKMAPKACTFLKVGMCPEVYTGSCTLKVTDGSFRYYIKSIICTKCRIASFML